MMSIIFKTSFRMPLFRSSSKLVWISASAGMSAPVMRHISTVKVRVGGSHNSVAEGNCVAVRRGGEQPEANCWSVGGRTRACSFMAKSENRWTRWRGGRSDVQAAHVVGDGTAAKVWCSKRGDLHGR